jgi:acetate kinase
MRILTINAGSSSLRAAFYDADGTAHCEPHLLTPEALTGLQRLVPIDPDHLPQALAVIHVTAELYPTIPQVACFDTAFHRLMPRVAQTCALPRRLAEAGVIRYGCHGLSCEYIVQALRATDPGAADGRIIIAHLGNGASLTAVREGASVDTTMGFTPTGGLMMGERSGDLDPGVLLHLLEVQRTSAEALNRLVNHEAGLLGVSGVSGDMHSLLDRESSDPRAAEAVALFCDVARKFLGALVAVLGGLEFGCSNSIPGATTGTSRSSRAIPAAWSFA